MSHASDAIKQQFPKKKMFFLKPRELDSAIVMVEEGVEEDTVGVLRIVYQKERLADILIKQLGWPVNKVVEYLKEAQRWHLKTNRAPVILDQRQLEQLTSGGAYG